MSQNFINGRDWRTASTDFKYGYVVGYLERYAPDNCYPLEETVTAVDRFYAEPANAEIPVSLAWTVIIRQVSGSSAAELDLSIEELRRHAMKLGGR